MSGRDQRPEHAQNERVILDLEAAAYRRGRRDAVREIVERLRWDADVAASGPGRFGELSARLGACADWIEREFGGAAEEASDG